LRCSGSRVSRSRSVADCYERRAHLDGLVFRDEDRFDNTGDWGGDFSVDLVGRYFEQRLVDLHAITYVLQPAGHRALCDTLSECWEVDGFAHQ
jgi:hypothetical protein